MAQNDALGQDFGLIWKIGHHDLVLRADRLVSAITLVVARPKVPINNTKSFMSDLHF